MLTAMMFSFNKIKICKTWFPAVIYQKAKIKRKQPGYIQLGTHNIFTLIEFNTLF